MDMFSAQAPPYQRFSLKSTQMKNPVDGDRKRREATSPNAVELDHFSRRSHTPQLRE